MKFFERKDLIFRLPISLQQKLILSRLHDFSGRKGVAYPSQGRLADDASIQPRQLRNHLAELRKRGLLIERRRKQETTIFKLNWEVIEHHAQERQPIAGQVASKSGSALPVKDEVKTGSELPVKANQDRQSITARPAADCRKTGSGLPTERNRTQLKVTASAVGSDFQTSPETTTKPAKARRKKIPNLTAADFASLDRGIEVIDGLVITNILNWNERLGALSVWYRIGQTLIESPGKITSPSGMFCTAVRDRTFLCGDAHEIVAETFLKAHDREASESRPPSPAMAILGGRLKAEIVQEEQW